MYSTFLWHTLTNVLYVLAACCFGATPQANNLPPKELQPRLVTLEKKDASLSEALRQLQKQTGNRIVDRRTTDDDPKITLNIQRLSFWKALDAIARAAGVRLSLFEDDGKIAIVNGGYRGMHIHYESLFRFSMKGIALQQNFRAGGKSCTVTLDVAWEPRFEPLYMETGSSTIIYAADKSGQKTKHEMPSRGTTPVARKSATEINLTYPGPARSVSHIESIRGNMALIAPVEMLAFEFDRLARISQPNDIRIQKKDGHEVRLLQLKTRPGRWSIDVKIVKPAGDVEFESFQSWMGNNRIMLVKDDGIKRTVLLPKTEDEELLEPESATGTAIRYHFVETNGQRLGNLADWRLVYVTPGRIVQFAVPYSFHNVPLP